MPSPETFTANTLVGIRRVRKMIGAPKGDRRSPTQFARDTGLRSIPCPEKRYTHFLYADVIALVHKQEEDRVRERVLEKERASVAAAAAAKAAAAKIPNPGAAYRGPVPQPASKNHGMPLLDQLLPPEPPPSILDPHGYISNAAVIAAVQRMVEQQVRPLLLQIIEGQQQQLAGQRLLLEGQQELLAMWRGSSDETRQ